jgi:hypothetical protein
MSLSKTRKKEQVQALESAATAPSTDRDQAQRSQHTGGDVVSLEAPHERDATSVSDIGGQSVGPVQIAADQGESGGDVGADLGEGGFFGWLGELFGWGDSAVSSSRIASPAAGGAGAGSPGVASGSGTYAVSDMSTVVDQSSTTPTEGYAEVEESEAANEAGFEEEEWIRDEDLHYLDYDKKQRTTYQRSDGAKRIITTQQTESSDLGRHSAVSSELGPGADREKKTNWNGTNKVGSEIRVDDSHTVGDTTYDDYWKAGGEGSLARDGDTRTGGLKLHGGVGSKVTTVNEDGSKTTLTSDHDFSAGSESIHGKKDDRDSRDRGLSLGYGYSTGTIDQHVADDGTTVQEKREEGVRGDLNHRTDKGMGGSLTFSETTQTRTVDTDGTATVTDKHTDATTLSADRQTVGASRKVSNTSSEQIDKLGDHTRLTTTWGKAEAEVGAKAGKDGDGNRYAEASASAKAGLYEQNVQHKWDNGGGEAEASWNALSAEANAKGRATLTEDGVKVGGSAGAKATLIGGNARIEAPTFGWTFLGEKMDVAVTAGVSAAVLAEANGNIDLDISKGDNLGVNLSGGGKAFAGAKAGVEVGAKLRWRRQPDYTDLIVDFAKSLPGGFDDYLVDKVPRQVWTEVSRVLIGSGKSDLLTGKAGVEGSAGVGGEAKFGLTLQGGKINVSGSLAGTVGLGVGVHTDLMLDAIDGVRFAGVLGMRGTEWLKDAIQEASSWYDEAVDVVQEKIDEFMEEEKAEGGFSGAVATAVDWLGDDLFDLW